MPSNPFFRTVMRRGFLGKNLRTLLVAIVSAGALSVGCRTITIQVSAYSVQRPASPGRFLAGRSVADITPPPGYPMGGHSIAARVSRGYWTRLHARAFFFRDATGQSLVLVSCDLFGIPAGLHAAVAQRVAEDGIAPANLILAATHTHHGPGNYLSSKTYNSFASPAPGFDSALFQFLVDRITQAVKGAVHDGLDHPGESAELLLRSGMIDDLVRNRATVAFSRNPDAEEILQNAPAAPPDCPVPCLRYRAVDPTATVLEVRRFREATSKRIALLVFFAVHATAMPHHAELYNADLVGRAIQMLERRAEPSDVLVGFFNGAEGDVSPRWTRQDREDAVMLGDRLAAAVARILLKAPAATDRNPHIEVLSRTVDRPLFCPPGSRRPEFGVASLGGAEDGRTVLYDLGCRAGETGPKRDDGQGVKRPALDFKAIPLLKLTHLLAPARDFPTSVPVSLVRLGPLSIAAVPVEMTTTTGWRVRKSLGPLEAPRWTVLVGLANEYLSYVATREEYEYQDYEGASTIFGEISARCFQELLTDLSRTHPIPVTAIPAARYRAGSPPLLVTFGPALAAPYRDMTDEELTAPFAGDSALPTRSWPHFEWNEDPSTDWSGTSRRVAILEERGGQWLPRVDADGPDDDGGSNILTVLADGRGATRRWTALWMPPGAAAGGRFRFSVRTPDGQTRLSEPFQLSQSR